MIGRVMLMGLVTKNAILLVDPPGAPGRRHAGRCLAAGRPDPPAADIMTTAAKVLGMLALALNEGGEL